MVRDGVLSGVLSADAGLLGRITLTGEIRDKSERFATGMRTLSGYALVFLTRGGGFYRDENGVDLTVGTGDLIMLFPGLAHAYGPEEPGNWDELYAIFDGEVFGLLERSGVIRRDAPVARLGDVEPWAGRLRRLLEPHATPQSVELLRQTASLLVMELALFIVESVTDPLRSELVEDHSAWLADVLGRMHDQPSQTARLQSYADDVGLKYDAFRKRFQRLLGTPPGEYYDRLVINEACALMRAGALTDTQIARRLGFTDPGYFSRAFRRVTGVSPRDYRRMHRSQVGQGAT